MTARASSYREIAPPLWLRRDLLCSWVGLLGPEGAPAVDRVLPDGCVDVVWDGERLLVAGPDETAVPLERRAGSVLVGVRLRPGRAPALLRAAAAELTGLRVDLAELWGREADEVAARLQEIASPEVARRLLERRVAARLDEARAADALRIMRFQRFVGLGRRYLRAELAALARAAGYADQAHLCRECRRLAALTPRELLLWQRDVPFVQDERAVRALSSSM